MMRTFYVIGIIVVAAIALGTFLFFFGPPSLQSDVTEALTTQSSASVPFTVLAHGTQAASIENRTNYRITTTDEMAALWPLVYRQGTAPPVPTVDFSKYEVLAVFDGSHSTGGYGVAVASVTDANAQRMVVIEHSIPGANCTVAQNATSPFEIIEVPATTYSLAHQDNTSTTTCP